MPARPSREAHSGSGEAGWSSMTNQRPVFWAWTNQRRSLSSDWAGWSSVVPSILILTSELACLGPLCLSPPPPRSGCQVSSQAGNISLRSQVSVFGPRVCIKYYLCRAQLCDKTYLGMDGGRVRERRECFITSSKNLYRDR